MNKLQNLNQTQLDLIERLGLKVELSQLQESLQKGLESEQSATQKLSEMLQKKISPVAGNELFFDHRGAYFGEEAKRRIMLGTYVSSAGYYDAYYNQAQKVRELARQDFVKAFQEVDLCLTPTSPEFPFKIGQKSSDPLKMYLSDVFTCGINPVRIPGLNVPIGFFPVRKDDQTDQKLSAGKYQVIILSAKHKYLLEGFELNIESESGIDQKAEFGIEFGLDGAVENLLEILGSFEKDGQNYAVLYFEDISQFTSNLKTTNLADEFIEQNIVYLPAGIQILGPEQSEDKIYDLGQEIEQIVDQEYR